MLLFVFYLSYRREREFVYLVEKLVIVVIIDKFRIYLEICLVILLVVLFFVVWIFIIVLVRIIIKLML